MIKVVIVELKKSKWLILMEVRLMAHLELDSLIKMEMISWEWGVLVVKNIH